jgi:hypothetical protein
MALCWALAPFSVFWSYTQSAGLLRQVISPSQGHYLHTGQHTNRIKSQASMPWEGFEPTILAFEQVKTVHALDHVATVISRYTYRYNKYWRLRWIIIQICIWRRPQNMFQRSKGLADWTKHHLQEIQRICPHVSGKFICLSTKLGHLSYHWSKSRKLQSIQFRLYGKVVLLCWYYMPHLCLGYITC